jgi:voltage-gated potassium channel
MSSERRTQPTRRRVDAFVHHPITEMAIVSLIVASVLLLVLEVIYDTDEDAYELLVFIGDAITWVFAVEMTLRFWVARKKTRFFRRYWIDLLALLPVLRPLRFFRVLRLFRLFRAGMFLSRRVSLFRGVFRGAFGELTLLGSITGVLVVAATTILYFVENPRSPFENLTDTLWFSVFSLVAGEPTLGEPETTLGRGVTLALMFGGMTIFGMFIGTISASMVSRLSKRPDVQELDLEEHDQHVVVCGWNASGPTVLHELLSGSKSLVAVVLITESEGLPDDIPDGISRDLLYHVSGDFTRVDILERANVRQASVAIVLSDNLTIRPDQDRDARTILAAMTIERLNSSIFTCAELRNRENDAALKMVGVDEIVVPEEYGGVILGSAGRNRGLVRVLDEVLSSRYGNSFHKVVLPKSWVGRRVRDLFVTLKERHDALLVSIERVRDGKRVTTTNPPLDQVLEADSVLVVIAVAPVKLED